MHVLVIVLCLETMVCLCASFGVSIVLVIITTLVATEGSTDGMMSRCGTGFIMLTPTPLTSIPGRQTFTAGFDATTWSIGGHRPPSGFVVRLDTTSFGLRLSNTLTRDNIHIAVETSVSRSSTNIRLTHSSPDANIPKLESGDWDRPWTVLGLSPHTDVDWPDQWEAVSIFTHHTQTGWVIINPLVLDPVGVTHIAAPKTLHSIITGSVSGSGVSLSTPGVPGWTEWMACSVVFRNDTTGETLCGLPAELRINTAGGTGVSTTNTLVAVVPELQFVLLSPGDAAQWGVSQTSYLDFVIGGVTFRVGKNQQSVLGSFTFDSVAIHDSVPRGMVVLGGAVVGALVVLRKDGKVRLAAPSGDTTKRVMARDTDTVTITLTFFMFIAFMLWLVHKGGRFHAYRPTYKTSVWIATVVLGLSAHALFLHSQNPDSVTKYVLWSDCTVSAPMAAFVMDQVTSLMSIGGSLFLACLIFWIWGWGVTQDTLEVLVLRTSVTTSGALGIVVYILRSITVGAQYDTSINMLVLVSIITLMTSRISDLIGMQGQYTHAIDTNSASAVHFATRGTDMTKLRTILFSAVYLINIWIVVSSAVVIGVPTVCLLLQPWELSVWTQVTAASCIIGASMWLSRYVGINISRGKA